MTREDFLAQYGDAGVVFNQFEEREFMFEGIAPSGDYIYVSVSLEDALSRNLAILNGCAEPVDSLPICGGEVWRELELLDSFFLTASDHGAIIVS